MEPRVCHNISVRNSTTLSVTAQKSAVLIQTNGFRTECHDTLIHNKNISNKFHNVINTTNLIHTLLSLSLLFRFNP
jgi:hypothetical protein